MKKNNNDFIKEILYTLEDGDSIDVVMISTKDDDTIMVRNTNYLDIIQKIIPRIALITATESEFNPNGISHILRMVADDIDNDLKNITHVGDRDIIITKEN